jgi:hypothetical protein
VNDLYVDGMTTEQFQAASGLELDLHKGGFVLSKRISRLIRPHHVSGFFSPDQVQIVYLELDKEGAKVWDGAGLISRRMLRKTALSEDLDPAKREWLEEELRHARRVEYTLMTPKGQDKGHAIVIDDPRPTALPAAGGVVSHRPGRPRARRGPGPGPRWSKLGRTAASARRQKQGFR